VSYLHKIFGKRIEDFEIEDLVSFFEAQQEETDVLEFKSGDVEIEDLYKEITAFLNTEGGLLIIGTPRERKEPKGKLKRTICQGELTYSRFRSKDWLYQKIMSNITPAPTGIKVFEHLGEDGTVFVLDIPQSATPPHQNSSDGRYYIRLEREAKPAPHGIVQALFQKRRLPKLSGEISISKIGENSDKICVSIRNLSKIPAEKVSFMVEAYKVEEIQSRFHFSETLQDSLGRKLSLNQSTDQLLVSVISFPIDFTVFHKGNEYIITVAYWCKDLDFDFQFWTYNPRLGKIVCEDKLKYEKVSLIDEIERLNSIG
jgi:hypothetical protein